MAKTKAQLLEELSGFGVEITSDLEKFTNDQILKLIEIEEKKTQKTQQETQTTEEEPVVPLKKTPEEIIGEIVEAAIATAIKPVMEKIETLEIEIKRIDSETAKGMAGWATPAVEKAGAEFIKNFSAWLEKAWTEKVGELEVIAESVKNASISPDLQARFLRHLAVLDNLSGIEARVEKRAQDIESTLAILQGKTPTTTPQIIPAIPKTVSHENGDALAVFFSGGK